MRGWLIVLLLLVACQKRAPAPVEPVWGKQACDHCMMLLSDPRPAAQALLSDGARRFFDDVGCMTEWFDRNGESAPHAWVKAPDGKAWVDAYTAHYSGGHRTPMDYGFLSADKGISFREMQRAVHERSTTRMGAPE